MSWLFSQALVEEYLGDTCLDGEPSAPLSGNSTQQAYCAPDKMTKFSRLSRFGMTYKPLTETRGEELLTLYLADFHARTLAQPEKAQELKETNPQCGNTWQGSLARLDPNTSLWKTAQCSLLEDLELSLQTFPRWGSMQNGALYQLPILVQTINVKEFGSEPKKMWLTPRVVEVDESPENFRRRMNSKRPNDRKDGFGSLTMQVKWLSPTCMDALPPRTPKALKKQHDNNRQGRATHSTLREQVIYPPPNQMWPTPISSSGGPMKLKSERGKFAGNPLATAVWMERQKWPTPQSRDHKGSSGRSNMGEELDLPTKVKMFPTPTANEDACGKPTGKMQKMLGNHPDVRQDPNGGTLNPNWVEWLMGWPPGFTDLKPLVMDKFHCAPQQHGSCLNE